MQCETLLWKLKTNLQRFETVRNQYEKLHCPDRRLIPTTPEAIQETATAKKLDHEMTDISLENDRLWTQFEQRCMNRPGR